MLPRVTTTSSCEGFGEDGIPREAAGEDFAWRRGPHRPSPAPALGPKSPGRIEPSGPRLRLIRVMSDGTQQVRDEYLALRLRHGDPAAFAELVRTFERPLLYYLTKLVGADAALDVLQDTWVAAFRAAGRLDDPRRLRPWLYRIARGRAIDRVRKDRSEDRLRQAHAEEVTTAADEEPAFGPDDAAAIHRALDALDVRHREVLV